MAHREAISALNHAKKAMLEASVFALQEGESLLEKLNQLWIQSCSDVRTDFKKESISSAIEQVSILISLHIFRQGKYQFGLWLNQAYDLKIFTYI